jgi:SOS response regulatory protein OraA/RecX
MRKPGRKAPLAEHEAYDLNHAFDYAVSLLARRDYSTHELKRKLEERGYSEHAYEVVVDDLESFGKINNERYGQNVVAYRARRGHGPARIRQQLRKSGLSRSAIDEAVKGANSARTSPRTGKKRQDRPDFCNTGAFQRIISAPSWRALSPTANPNLIRPQVPE